MRHRFLPPEALRRLVVLGVGRLTTATAEYAREYGLEATVFGGPRQVNATLADGRLAIDRLAELGVEVRIVEDIRKCPNGPYQLPAERAVVLSLGSPFVIRQDLIDRYEGRIINSHGAPLPEWRGGGGFSWRILAGDRRGHSCFHLVTPRIDDGDVVLERSYEFPDTVRTPQQYMDHAERQDRALLRELLDGLRQGRSFELRRQDESRATYFPRLDSRRQGYIDWSWPGDEIERFILAFSHPYDGAKTFIGDTLVRVFDAHFAAGPARRHAFFNGLILRALPDQLVVACTGGTLNVPRTAIAVEAEPKPGDRLVTPAALVEEALRLRPRYTPAGLTW